MSDNSIRLFKLVTGEDIITAFTKDHSTQSYQFHKPRVFQIRQVDEGFAPEIRMPWILVDPDATVPVQFDKIVTQVDVPKQLEDMYLQLTSGIALATSLPT